MARRDANCVFCKIAAGEIASYRIYEDSLTIAFMDINPAASGHALVIPREHWPDIHTLPPELLSATARTAQRVAAAVATVLEPAGLNLVQANGAGAAQSVSHFHIHVLPRALDDGLALNWSLRPGEPAQLESLAVRLKAQLACSGGHAVGTHP